MKNTMLVTGLLVASLTVSATAAGHENKKLIQYGWGPPTPGYVAKHIRQMETRPFDGIAMILDRRSFNHVFYSRELDDEQTQAYLDDLAAIPWETLDRVAARPGTKLAANVSHMRFRQWGGHKPQYSTWSQTRGVEGKPSHVRVQPESLGDWTFE